jgi:hypothetical protein
MASSTDWDLKHDAGWCAYGLADTRATAFAAEAARQSRFIAKAESADEWAFVEQYFLAELARLD